MKHAVTPGTPDFEPVTISFTAETPQELAVLWCICSIGWPEVVGKCSNYLKDAKATSDCAITVNRNHKYKVWQELDGRAKAAGVLDEREYLPQ